jgi:TRAP transporter TAXI family solute receptor
MVFVMKKGILCALLFSLVLLFQAPEAQSAQTRFSIATGGTAGVYFPIGGAIAKAVSKTGALQVTAESSNASVANVNLLSRYEIEMAFVQNDVTFWAYNGQNMFEKPLPNLRTVMALYPEHVHWVISKTSDIKSIGDLRGKRVNVGPPGSGYEAGARSILQVAGMTFDDLRANRLDNSGATARFKDTQLAAALFVLGYPAPAPMDIATSRPITLLDFDEEFMAKLTATHPFFVPSIIPSGTYQGIDKDTVTPAVMAIIVTHDKMPEQTVYTFLANLFDNLEEVQAAHAKAREITLENALGGVGAAPMHPGAVKFFKEKGLSLP